MISDLTSKLKSRSAVIGIVGLGYVGLPLSIRFSQSGYSVIGFDNDPQKVESLNNGLSYIEHISSAEIEAIISSGFSATTDYSLSAKCDAIILCVPTPLNKHREPDLSFVFNSVDGILPYLRPGQIIS